VSCGVIASHNAKTFGETGNIAPLAHGETVSQLRVQNHRRWQQYCDHNKAGAAAVVDNELKPTVVRAPTTDKNKTTKPEASAKANNKQKDKPKAPEKKPLSFAGRTAIKKHCDQSKDATYVGYNASNAKGMTNGVEVDLLLQPATSTRSEVRIRAFFYKNRVEAPALDPSDFDKDNPYHRACVEKIVDMLIDVNHLEVMKDGNVLIFGGDWSEKQNSTIGAKQLRAFCQEYRATRVAEEKAKLTKDPVGSKPGKQPSLFPPAKNCKAEAGSPVVVNNWIAPTVI